MKGYYSTTKLKFLPPRPTNCKLAIPDNERRTPPLVGAASECTPAPAKRAKGTANHTTLWWTKPRKLDLLTSSRGTRGLTGERPAGTAPPRSPSRSNDFHTSRRASSNAHAHVSSPGGKNIPTLPADEGSSSIRERHTIAQVMAADTPARPRRYEPSVGRGSFGSSAVERMEGLVIPDTQEEARPEPEPEGNGSSNCFEGKSAKGVGSSSHNNSGFSDSLFPPSERHNLDRKEQGIATGSPVGHADTSNSSEGSDTGTESPDLLRDYRTRVEDASQETRRTLSCSHHGSIAGRVVPGEPASEGSDTGAESPDLLRAYQRADDVSEEPRLAIAVETLPGPATRSPSKKRPRQETPQVGPRNPYTKFGIAAQRSHSSRAEGCPPQPSITRGISGKNKAKGPRMDTGAGTKEILRLDGGRRGVESFREVESSSKRTGAHHARGSGGKEGAEKVMPAPRGGSLSTIETTSDAGDGSKACGGSAAIGSPSMTPSSTARSASAARSTRRVAVCDQMGNARSRALTNSSKGMPCCARKPLGTKGGAPVIKVHPIAGNTPRTATVSGHEWNDKSVRRNPSSGATVRNAASADVLAAESESATPCAAEATVRLCTGTRRPADASSVISRPPDLTMCVQRTVTATSAVGTPRAAAVKAHAEPLAQAAPSGHGLTGDDPNSPPAASFEVIRQQMYKKSHAGAGQGGKGRGRGRSGGWRAGRGRKGVSKAPAPAAGALLGSWRTEVGQKGERSKRYYISRAGHRLTGREAFNADQEDRKAAKKGPVVVDRSTIMSIGRREDVDSPLDARGSEKHLHDDALKLKTYGIPDQLVESYEKRGVRKLFPWQAHCLRVDGGKPLSGGNLVYSAPTSGGKTLVAELLLLRALLQHNGTMALLVVPFIALAMEKRDYLRDVWGPLQLNVQAFHGSEGGDGSSMEGVNVAVCTIEKANSIVNRLAEENRLEVLSAVVVDEMHLIGDGQRGFLLELMLTKLRMTCPTKVQLVCLSATLPNIECIAKWLESSLYKTKFRPVELRHRVCKGRLVYEPSPVEDNKTGQAGYDQTLVKAVGGKIQKIGGTSPSADPDGVVDLVKDALAKDMSVLVFCATKKWCQTTAALLANEILSDRARALAKTSAAAGAAAAAAAARRRLPPARGHRGIPDQRPEEAAAARGSWEEEQQGRQKHTPVLPSSPGRPLNARNGEGLDGALFEGFVPATSTVPDRGAAKTTMSNSDVIGHQEKTSTKGGVRAMAISTEGFQADRHQATTAAAASTVRARLRETPVGLDAELAHLVEASVAFHHSGLVVEERSILEDAFRQGSIRVLVATSTLAAGVNLPAHRVIIRSPHIGIEPLNSTRYHQMAGRSGRAGVSRGQEGGEAAEGVDTACGESFLIIPKNDKFTIPEASKLISAPLPKLESALRGAKGGGLERALLEVVVSKTVTSKDGARRFGSKTLLAAQIKEENVRQACDSAMKFLLENNFIVKTAWGESGGEGGDGSGDYGVAPTQLGQATFFSGLSPSAAVDVHRSLDKACENLVVATELHALYLLTPLDGLEPDWARFREEYTGWREEDPARVVGKAVGIEEGVLVNARHIRPKYGKRYYKSPRGSNREVDLQPYRRFFGALLLQQAVEEVPVRNMSARLGIERGTLQALQKEASVFCGMVVCFCRHLQWHELANVLHSFQDRLGYSAKPELLPLVRLSRDLPPFRARALLEAGYPSPLKLAVADAARVAEVLLRCAPFRGAGWDESVERYRSTQAKRLAENVICLANAEVLRQLRDRRPSAPKEGGSSIAKGGGATPSDMTGEVPTR